MAAGSRKPLGRGDGGRGGDVPGRERVAAALAARSGRPAGRARRPRRRRRRRTAGPGCRRPPWRPAAGSARSRPGSVAALVGRLLVGSAVGARGRARRLGPDGSPAGLAPRLGTPRRGRLACRRASGAGCRRPGLGRRRARRGRPASSPAGRPRTRRSRPGCAAARPARGRPPRRRRPRCCRRPRVGPGARSGITSAVSTDCWSFGVSGTSGRKVRARPSAVSSRGIDRVAERVHPEPVDAGRARRLRAAPRAGAGDRDREPCGLAGRQLVEVVERPRVGDPVADELLGVRLGALGQLGAGR